MDIKSLEELQRPDDRTRSFTPFGIGTRISAQDAAAYHQQAVAHLDLADAVCERVRHAYEQLRDLYAYGILWYDIYGVAHDRARLILEYALRERLLDYYGGTIVFIDKNNTTYQLQPASFEELSEEIHKGGRLYKPHQWRLRVNGAGETLYFDGMLTSLMRWAHAAGLLHGQRNRNVETLLKNFRNRAAHGAGFHLLDPGFAALAISDLAEIINQLWNAPTPGGRLYPAPVRRVVTTIGWNARGLVTWNPSARFTADLPDAGELTCVVVLAKEHDGDLPNFDAQYETTYVPCDLLWGPGSPADAEAWVEQNHPAGDEVDILDRLFLVRHHEGRLYLPRNPEIAAGLAPAEQTGTWYLIRADYPHDAFHHLRQLLAGGFGCTPHGPCKRPDRPGEMPCAVETLSTGTWQEIIAALAAAGTPATPRPVPDIRVPSGPPRWNEDLREGSWSVPPR